MNSMNNELMSRLSLPAIPATMHPIAGTGLEIAHLLSRHEGAGTPEQAMAYWRSRHTPDKAPFACMFYMEPLKRNKNLVQIKFLLDRAGRRTQMVGQTLNNPHAAKILIGNWKAGCYMSESIRWELYGDRTCDDFIGYGRFDQWDLLAGLSAIDFSALAAQGCTPQGNWDFYHCFLTKQCTFCNAEVTVNYYLYNIDSAVCATCGNRPFLAFDLHRYLDAHQDGSSEQRALHVFRWLGSVNATYAQVRRDIEDGYGKRIRAIWGRTLMGQTLDPSQAKRVKSLFEANGDEVDFAVYQHMARQVDRALNSEIPFSPEVQVALQYLLGITDLLRVKQIATKVD
jgi:hypothetical protein